MTPDGKTFDPETVTDKQLVQYEQAIDRGLTEADAMRLTEHEYNGFQANAIIAAALNPAVGENVLDALATPKYTAAQMTAIAKIAIRGGDFARFLNPQMDARRMEAAYLVVEMGDFYTVLNGDIVAVGFDPETGESRSLTDGETARVEGYFTVISRPGSGAKAVDDIRHGITPGGYDISVESHDCTSGRNALAADAPARDAPGKDDQNIE